MSFLSKTIHEGGIRAGPLETDCLALIAALILAGRVTLVKKVHLNFILPSLTHLRNGCSSNTTLQRILMRSKSKELIIKMKNMYDYCELTEFKKL